MARLQKFIELYRYDTMLHFSQPGDVKGPDGVFRPATAETFQENFKLWGAPYELRNQEQVNSTGPNEEEEMVFAVKELGKVKRNMWVLYDSELYMVVDVRRWADKKSTRGYDLITLFRGNGAERKYRGVS